MKERTKFWQAFLGGGEPSTELLAAFGLGLLIVGVIGNLIYDLLTVLEPLWADLVLVGGVALAGTLLAYGLYRRDRRRRRTVQVEVDESRLAPPHAALIWMLGPGNFDHLLFAIDHHRQGGGAEHCWLVMEDTARVRAAFGQLSQILADAEVPTLLHPLYIPTLDVRASYEAVRAVYDREAQKEGLPPDQVIADITGGTKPLTAGMVLAAMTAGQKTEYVESERDSEGFPIENTRRVILVDADFVVTQ